MSKYDEELRRRIWRGDPIPDVCMWFVEQMAKSPDIKLSDFSPFELRFWNDIREHFEARQKLN